MKTKILVPAVAAVIGGYFLYKHVSAQKAHAAAVAATAQANAVAAATPAPMNGLGDGPNGSPSGSPFASHLAPIRSPSAFWSAGGWVGDTVTKPGRNYNVYPQQAPNIVDAYIGAGGVAVVGVAPPGAQEVKVMVDNSGTVLQVLRSKWKSDDNVAGLGGMKFNLSKVGKAATALTSKPVTAPLHLAKNLALPAAHSKLLNDPTVVRNIAAAVATTGAAHLIGSHITVAGTLQAGPGSREITALTDASGHVLATYATKSGQSTQSAITSFQATPGTPSASLSGLGSLGFSLSHAISAVTQTVTAPLKITVATLKTSIAPAAALVTLAKTGSLSAATATLKTDLTAIPTAGKSIASSLISTAKSATAKSPVATPTGVQASVTAPAGSLPGDPTGASWPVDATTASGWPGVWTNVPTGAAGWQYGDVGDGTGDGLLQNVGLQVSFTATPSMILAAGGNPATVVTQYLALNPTAAGATGASTPTTAGSAQSYGWPATWTTVPNNVAYQYMAAQDGTGNGSFMNPTTGATYTATPQQIQMYSGIPASVLASLISGVTTGGNVASSAQSYGWPATWTPVPSNTTWSYMAAQDGTGNGSFMNSATGQTLIASPTQLAMYAGNPSSVLASLLGGVTGATGGAQTYGWPTTWTLVPGNTLWQYMAATDGSGNGLLQNPSQGQSFTATPAMISAAGGSAVTVIANYTNQNAAMMQPGYGMPGGGYDDDTGAGYTNPEVAADGTPIDPATGLPQTGVDANGNPIVQQGGTAPPLPVAPPAPAGKVNWLVAGGAALALPAFMYFKK
jgi:hypothetical protein